MAHSLKGSALTETALITPVVIIFFLSLFQFAQIIHITWFVEQAAQASCRAALVKDTSHPDPEVAAQLTLLPIMPKPFNNTQNLGNFASQYGSSILKTSVKTEKNDSNISCQIHHAAQLTIPFVNHLVAPVTNLTDWFTQTQNQSPNLAEKWAALTGKSHLLIEQQLEIEY